MSDRQQGNEAIFDNRPTEMYPEEIHVVREILSQAYPDFVLEILSSAPVFGEILNARGLERGLVVRAHAEELHADLVGASEDEFEVVDLGELDTEFRGHALVMPANMPVLQPLLREFGYSEFFLMTYVPEEYWENVIGPRDHAPSITYLKSHFGQFAADNEQLPPPMIHRDSDLVLAAMRHVSWSEDERSVSFIYSRVRGEVVGRS